MVYGFGGNVVTGNFGTWGVGIFASFGCSEYSNFSYASFDSEGNKIRYAQKREIGR